MELTVTLNDVEQKALMDVIDAALRHAGAGALDVATHFKAKMDAARKEEATKQPSDIGAPTP